MPTISIIILTYNSSKYIEGLIESLLNKYHSELDERKLEIIVADNLSHDDTVKKATKYKKDILIVENKGNFGFAKGNNLASEKAKGEYLIFINPDTKPHSGNIFDLLDVFNDEKVGIVGGRVLNWDEQPELSCGSFYNLTNVMFLATGLEEKLHLRFSPDKEKRVDFVSGAFLMIRRKLFERMKGFDENYFMYIEDSDLCFRAKKLGFKTIFSPKATIRHMGQGSSNRTFAIVNIYKGLIYFNKKNSNRVSYLLVRQLLLAKARLLVLGGKMMNNKYLVETYNEALKI